ncbi:Uncharacterised protein [Serratia fonticola]|uniref:Uncharacterized protein n=1 Tax=Serratia fonticola TaxID=47917 RepID=A0A4U9TBC2_SERFO|nr:Uncharacterised protein [Serratia fonticola]
MAIKVLINATVLTAAPVFAFATDYYLFDDISWINYYELGVNIPALFSWDNHYAEGANTTPHAVCCIPA